MSGMPGWMPRLQFLSESQLAHDSCHSQLISWLRGMAALQVAAAHLRAEFMPGLRTLDNPTLWYQALAFLTGFAHQAVIVFFVVSGWLVGGSFLNKRHQRGALGLYAIDRVTRLWTVLIPTFALTLAFGILSGTLDARSVDFSHSNAFSATSFIGNLLGLQTVSLPKFGDNYPLWSLANEFWYYLMFPLLVAARTSRRPVAPLLALAGCTALIPLEMTAYFSIWLLGAAFSRIRLDCGATIRTLLLLALVALAIIIRVEGINDDITLASYPQDLLLGITLVLLLSSTVRRPAPKPHYLTRVRRAVELLSQFSFTLYVIHIPLLGMVAWLGFHLLGRRDIPADSWYGLAIYMSVLVGLLLVSYCFYCLFEARTSQIRRWVKTRVAAAARPRFSPVSPP